MPLLTRLLPGMVLYHGTPYGKKFVHPRGPAWFTPDKSVTEDFLDRPWSSRAEAWAQKIEKNPRRLKFRLKRMVKLPWVGPPFGTEKEEVLAHYAAPLFPHLSEEALTEAIEVLGTSSGSSWVRAEEDLDRGFYSNLFTTEGTEDAVRELTGFKDVVGFMQHLCQNTGFEGWIQRYEDGTSTEVALCDPKGLLRPAASQVPRGPKMTRRQKMEAIRKEIQKKKDRDGYRAKMEAERLRQEAERDKEEDLQYKVYLSVTNQAEPGELDYSDPEFRRALNNWTDYLSPRQLGYTTDSWDDVTAKNVIRRASSATLDRLYTAQAEGAPPMSRKLTASDRKNLIRLASEMPKGSPERKAILAGLKKTSGYADHTYDGELLQAVQSAGWRNHSWGEVGGSGFSLRNVPSLSKKVKLPNGIEFDVFLAFGKGRLWVGMDPETGISDADILPYEVASPNAPQLQRLDTEYWSLGERPPSGFESGEDYAFNGWVLIPTGSPERDLKRGISAFKKYANAVTRIYMAFEPLA